MKNDHFSNKWGFGVLGFWGFGGDPACPKTSEHLGVGVGGDSGQADKGNASSYLRDGVGTTATPM